MWCFFCDWKLRLTWIGSIKNAAGLFSEIEYVITSSNWSTYFLAEEQMPFSKVLSFALSDWTGESLYPPQIPWYRSGLLAF